MQQAVYFERNAIEMAAFIDGRSADERAGEGAGGAVRILNRPADTPRLASVDITED